MSRPGRDSKVKSRLLLDGLQAASLVGCGQDISSPEDDYLSPVFERASLFAATEIGGKLSSSIAVPPGMYCCPDSSAVTKKRLALENDSSRIVLGDDERGFKRVNSVTKLGGRYGC